MPGARNKKLEQGRDASVESIEDICRFFWQIEREHNLLAWKAHDVFIWPLLRMKLYYDVSQSVGLFDAPHPVFQKRKAWHKLRVPKFPPLALYFDEMLEGQRSATAPIWSLFRRGKLRNRTPYVLLRGDRRISGKEPLTQALREELGGRVLTLERAAAHRDSEEGIDYRQLQRAFKRRYRSRVFNTLPGADLKRCEELVIAFRKSLGVNIDDLFDIAQRKVKRFLAERTGFEKFFTIHRTETLFVVDAYNAIATVAAAQRAGARVVELQHGFISQFHLGYSWPGRPEVPYSPDELWCYGNFWPETTPLAAGLRPRVIGAPRIEELAQMTRVRRDDNLVIFNSQGVIGRKLFDLALATAGARPDKKIIFRLHPNELLEDYRALEPKCGFPPNFNLSHQKPNIFALMAQASIQVGVFSTTLLEGMALGVRTIVVELPGVEYMRPVVARGDALLVRCLDELIDQLDQAPFCKDPKYYYDTPVKRLV